MLSARGYISTSETTVHFGLGNVKKVDSVVVSISGKSFVFNNLEINKTTKLKLNAVNQKNYQNTEGVALRELLFENVDAKTFGLDFLHKEEDIIDFNAQRTLPHKFSQFGPSLSVGDVNGDGFDDFYIGGSAKNTGTLFFNKKMARFNKKMPTLKQIKKKEKKK
ncbi:MAG: hypothetical protein HC817_08635 [Saprospiraceae bacterium]|nr:hypothetical protein [Saprospiraceae bacterium]